MIHLLTDVAAGLAALPAMLTFVNLALFRAPAPGGAAPAVTVVIPARNEAAAIGACLAAVLASVGTALEVIVVDDHSDDATAAIVAAAAAPDPRVRLLAAPALPRGWSGKQHACHVGAGAARHPVLLFIDADVRLAPDAVARMAAHLRRAGVALASGFPRERTETLGEALLVPLIHVLLLGYFPLPGMRLSASPGFGVGCGQLMVADAAAYRRVGGHGAVRASWHDGLTLPRAFRAHGLRTDIFDATALAECRMYAGFAAAWHGAAKNAGEGMATPRALPLWTLLLAGGQVLPFVLLPVATPALWAATAALAAARVAVAIRFRQAPVSVPLLPFGMLTLLAVQWRVLLGRGRGGARVWRGRPQVSG